MTEGVLQIAIKFLADRLKEQPGLHEDVGPEFVVMKNFVNNKGENNLNDGEIGIMLLNIEEEKFLKPQVPKEKRIDESVSFSNPEIYLNLYLLIAIKPSDTGGDNYGIALSRLSLVLEYFQAYSFFEDVGINGSPKKIEKMMVDLYTLSFEQQNQIWTSIGSKYMPSVVYKIRLVVIDRDEYGPEQKLIKEVGADLQRIN
jgi:hypothetical protein